MKEIEAILRTARDQKQLEYDFDLRTVSEQIFSKRFIITNKVLEEYKAETPPRERSYIDFCAWITSKMLNQVW